jgi:hypothetical protein
MDDRLWAFRTGRFPARTLPFGFLGMKHVREGAERQMVVKISWPAFEFTDRMSGREAGTLVRLAPRYAVGLQTGGSPQLRRLRHYLCANPDRRYTRTGEQRNFRSV